MSRLIRLLPLVVVFTTQPSVAMPRVSAATPGLSRPVVEWLSVPGCPSEREVIGLVEGHLGQALSVQREQAIRLRAEVKRNDANEYEVALSTAGASGNGLRRIAHADCNKLAEATALVMAIAIDPKLVEAQAEAEVTKQTNETARPPARVPSDVSSVPGDSPKPIAVFCPQAIQGNVKLAGTVTRSGASSPGHWSLSAVALVGRGLLPVIDLGAMATIGIVPTEGLLLRAGAGGYLPTTESIPNSSGQLTTKATFVDLAACAQPFEVGRWQSHLCASMQLGLIGADAEGNDIANPRDQSAPFATVGLETGYGYRFGRRLGVSASVAAGIAALRPRFGVNRNGQPEEDHRPELGVFRLGMGVFWDSL